MLDIMILSAVFLILSIVFLTIVLWEVVVKKFMNFTSFVIFLICVAAWWWTVMAFFNRLLGAPT